MSTATLKPISQTSTTRPRLLVVDDEPEILSILRDAIAALQFIQEGNEAEVPSCG